MITRSTASVHSSSPSWQQTLSAAVSDPSELLQRLGLPPERGADARAADAEFRFRVPEPFIQRMRPGDPQDPLLKQVLPVAAERRSAPGYTPDPLDEPAQMPAQGLIHKYQGRVLMTVTGACAINCRYCFRRHFPYEEEVPGRAQWRAALEYIKLTPSVREVILSGGDPLVSNDKRLSQLADELADIGHLKRLRVHTRMPIVIPRRVTDELLNWLTGTRLQPVVVVHVNHPRELDPAVAAAVADLRAAGASVFNQTVLMRGINDSAEVLTELSEALFDSGILPYYLHLLDPVQGATHFDVPASQAEALWADALSRLPGYLVPRLVQEQPEMPAKVPLAANFGDSD